MPRPKVLTDGIRRLRREPISHGGAGGWAWVVHPMHDWETEDYDDVDYQRLCPDGTELAVFEMEPCNAKCFPPAFSSYRDGRTVIHFSFDDLRRRLGDNPDHPPRRLLPPDQPAAVPGGDGPVSLLPADTYLTSVRGMDLPTLTGILTEVDRPPLTSGVSGGWVWVTHAAQGAGWELARDLRGS